MTHLALAEAALHMFSAKTNINITRQWVASWYSVDATKAEQADRMVADAEKKFDDAAKAYEDAVVASVAARAGAPA